MELASRQHVGPADRRWHSGRSAARRSAARGQRTPRIAAGAFWPKAVAQQVIEQRAVGARSLPATRGIMMTAILSSAAAGRRILQSRPSRAGPARPTLRNAAASPVQATSAARTRQWARIAAAGPGASDGIMSPQRSSISPPRCEARGLPGNTGGVPTIR